MAASSVGSALAWRDLNTACAASNARRIGGEQRQAAERGVDRAAQPVVEAHGVEIGRRIAGDRLSGGGVGQLAGIRP